MRKNDKREHKKTVTEYTERKVERNQLVVRFSRGKTSQKVSSEEDSDYNEVEFFKLQKEINAKYGVTLAEQEAKKTQSIISVYSETTTVSSNYSKNRKSCLRRCLRNICCCCCRKSSQVAPIDEGMNDVQLQDQGELNDLQQTYLSDNINYVLHPASPTETYIVQDSISLPPSITRARKKKNVNFKGIVKSS